MFEEIAGLPAHPLLIHAAVVFIPLLAIGAITYAVLPRLRPRIWWVVGLLALVAAGSAVLARFSGEAFRARLVRRQASPQLLDAIAGHEHFGTMAMWFTLALAVAALVLMSAAPPRATGTGTAGIGTDSHAALDPRDAGHGAAPGSGGTGSTATRVAAAATRTAATRPRANPAVTLVLAVVTIALAMASLYYVYRTGDSGAHIVWNGS